MSYWDEREPIPSLEELLEQKEEQIDTSWTLVRNEAECEFCDADIDKMLQLLEELKQLDEDRTNILEQMDRRDGTW